MEILDETKIKGLVESMYSKFREEALNGKPHDDDCTACKITRDFVSIIDLMYPLYRNLWEDLISTGKPSIIVSAFQVGFDLCWQYRDLLEMEKSGLIKETQAN